MVALWPQPDPALEFPRAVASMDCLMEITREVRNIRSSYSISPGQQVPLLVKTWSAEQDAVLAACREYLVSLARLSRLEFGQALTKPPLAATVVVQGLEAHVPLADVIDVGAERQRVQKELAKTEATLERIARKLGNADFVDKAPAEVVSQQKAAHAELADQHAKLKATLAHLEAHTKNSD
jgi:valyl-tRNA synthetase